MPGEDRRIETSPSALLVSLPWTSLTEPSLGLGIFFLVVLVVINHLVPIKV